jgi:hypothetical protein
MLSYTGFVITPNGLGIASCWALAWRQGEISARQPEEEGQINNFPTIQRKMYKHFRRFCAFYDDECADRLIH